jgi:TDG/mug DNA glycosylase family protein
MAPAGATPVAGGVPDLLGPDLAVLFCGINPGRYSGATGYHFAGPGNRFWQVLHRSGFTPRTLRPDESGELPARGIGITNLVARTTATAAELTRAEVIAGADRLCSLVAEHRPLAVVVLGVGAYRTAFDRKAQLGRQPGEPTGAPTYVLPNPSGLQARYGLDEITALLTPVLALVPPTRAAKFSASLR